MLSFTSASVRIANTERAVDECMEIAQEEIAIKDMSVVIVNTAMGHKLDRIADAVRKQAPQAVVFGTSCGGVVGREGAGEAMSNMAMMMMGGPQAEYATAAVDDIRSENAYDRALALAGDLKAKLPGVSVVYLVAPGLDINCDLIIQAFDEVLGPETVIFGGTSADNYKAIVTYQYIGDHMTQHGAFAIGMADPTLKVATKASHGFTPYGDPMVVTKAEGNRLIEIDGMPAWAAYGARLSLVPEEGERSVAVIAAGGLAKRLPDDLAKEYGSTHILRGAAQDKEQGGVMLLSVSTQAGEEFWLTMRDEALIFSEQEKALAYLQAELDGHSPVAVFQADCLARGRTLFNKVMKDEIIGMMQSALSDGEETPPWLGMYGFGEFCPLGGRNAFHTYTTSLMVLYR
ncbi:FIST C-terminal domain-containing protein [Eubacteriales bacterium OttesenSCG-928-A19]|nr:FIST C-terminal domain-containing protein [Eubacteriales bacterium OttesenSCG-928-A19]